MVMPCEATGLWICLTNYSLWYTTQIAKRRKENFHAKKESKLTQPKENV